MVQLRDFFGDLCRGFALRNQPRGLKNQIASAGREVFGVNCIDPSKEFSGHPAILMGGRERARKIQVDDFIPLVYERFEVVQILSDIDRGGLWQRAMVPVGCKNIIRKEIDAVPIFLSIQQDVIGDRHNLIALFQRFI